jgi:hypothetical protein
MAAITSTKEKKGGQMMKVQQKAYGNKWDGPKSFPLMVPICPSKP